MERLYTIGVYGKTEDEFIQALTKARIDTFCDVRLRRGVRGSQYAFANSTRLEALLTEHGITYLHVMGLAPTLSVRALQFKADEQQHIPIRQRQEISDAFRKHYIDDILSHFDAAAFLKELGPAKRAVLFCVEAHAEACHRSLAAERLSVEWKVPLEHL